MMRWHSSTAKAHHLKVCCIIVIAQKNVVTDSKPDNYEWFDALYLQWRIISAAPRVYNDIPRCTRNSSDCQPLTKEDGRADDAWLTYTEMKGCSSAIYAEVGPPQPPALRVESSYENLDSVVKKSAMKHYV